MESADTVFKFTTRLVLTILIVFILIIGKSFLTPLAWAIVISLASIQFIDKIKLKTKLPSALIIILFLIAIVTVIFFLIFFFYVELSHIVTELPEISDKISSGLHQLSVNLASSGIQIPDHIDNQFFKDWIAQHSDSAMDFVRKFGLGLEHLVLGAVYLFFILYYGDLAKHFLDSKVKDVERRKELDKNISQSISIIKSYIMGLLILALISATLVFIILFLLGVDYALFFAGLLGVLSLIPFIGNPIGLIIIGLFTYLTKDSLVTPFLAVGLIWLMNVLHENVIRPVLMGDRLQINAFVVFIAVIVGGLIWGVSGMILFIPIAGIIKVVLMQNEKTSHYAILLSEKPKKTRDNLSKT